MGQGYRTRELATYVDSENPTIGDWRIVDGQFSWLAADDPQATAQAIWRRLRTYQGEVASDQRRGFPWFQSVLGRRGVASRLQMMLRRAVSGTPGVRACDSVSYTVDASSRSVEIQWAATFDSGKIYTSDDFEIPYIVEVDR